MPEQFFDPSIPLGIKVPPPAAAQNPFELLSGVAGAQKALVEAQSAKAVLVAHAKAGQYIAAAPTIDEGIKAIMGDPETAGFAQDIISSMASTKQTLDAAQGLEQTQNSSAMEFVMRNIASNLNNPAGLPDTIAGSLAALPPAIRARNGLAITSVVKSLTDGLPEDPAEAAAEFQKRLAATSTAIGGVPPDTIRAQTGNLPPSFTIAPLGPNNSNIVMQTGGAMAGPQAPPHQAGLLEGLSPADQAAQTAKAGNTGPLQEEMADAASSVPVLVPRINLMLDSLGNFQAGGGADVRGTVGRLMQGLKNMGVGITQKQIDTVANSSLKDTEIFQQELKPLLIGQLKEVAQGRFLQSEVDAFAKSLDETNDPEAILTELNRIKSIAQLQYDKSEKYLTFKQLLKEKDPSVVGLEEGDFPIWYATTPQGELPSKTSSGIDIGPRGADKIKGTSGSKPSLDDIFGAP